MLPNCCSVPLWFKDPLQHLGRKNGLLPIISISFGYSSYLWMSFHPYPAFICPLCNRSSTCWGCYMATVQSMSKMLNWEESFKAELLDGWAALRDQKYTLYTRSVLWHIRNVLGIPKCTSDPSNELKSFSCSFPGGRHRKTLPLEPVATFLCMVNKLSAALKVLVHEFIVLS